jgi:hypothetical protein
MPAEARPPPEVGYVPAASKAVEEPSAALSVTEESFLPPGPSIRLPAGDSKEFEDRFAATFGPAKEIVNERPLVPAEPAVARAARAAPDRPVLLAAIEAPFRQRQLRSNVSGRHTHRLIKQPVLQLSKESAQLPAHRIRPAERKQPVSRADVGSGVRGPAAKHQRMRFARSV